MALRSGGSWKVPSPSLVLVLCFDVAPVGRYLRRFCHVLPSAVTLWLQGWPSHLNNNRKQLSWPWGEGKLLCPLCADFIDLNKEGARSYLMFDESWHKNILLRTELILFCKCCWIIVVNIAINVRQPMHRTVKVGHCFCYLSTRFQRHRHGRWAISRFWVWQGCFSLTVLYRRHFDLSPISCLYISTTYLVQCG